MSAKIVQHPRRDMKLERDITRSPEAQALQEAIATAVSRNTQKMPLRTRRSFTRATPRGLFGSIDLMAAHSWSVSS
jgi:hypothetical protein